ncbi:RNA polymerase sigma factor [Flexithrix dorotheae]|uniref:RNA polymerase sigma factor n=1 Tax=Flexithrix dorotheae TaxID=70993 RepID=UPI00036EF157|nr:sigma-70 family RNA polymerase sigma factor [Flexithrix dorotheae]
MKELNAEGSGPEYKVGSFSGSAFSSGQKEAGRSDYEIWISFKKGDESAFNLIYRKYTALLFNFGYQYTDNIELIRDCTQNMFIDLRRQRNNLSDVTSIKAYLFKALSREIIRKLNKEKRYIFNSTTIEEKGFGIELSTETKIIREEFSKENLEMLSKALETLTSKQRQAILLFYKEGFSYIELAQAMELKNAKSARKLLYRALAALKKEFGEGHNDGFMPSVLLPVLLSSLGTFTAYHSIK